MMNKITFWGQYWWFWAIVAGVPVAAYLGYKYMEGEGYFGPKDEEFFDIDKVQVGAYR